MASGVRAACCGKKIRNGAEARVIGFGPIPLKQLRG